MGTREKLYHKKYFQTKVFCKNDLQIGINLLSFAKKYSISLQSYNIFSSYPFKDSTI